MAVGSVTHRFAENVLPLRDPDGLQLELVAVPEAETRPYWTGGPVPAEYAIRGFLGVTLTLAAQEPTAGLLTELLGFRPAGRSGARYRYEVGNGVPGGVVDLLVDPGAPIGRVAVGSVHHVAWRVPDDTQQAMIRVALSRAGYRVTPVQDRKYFRSIYFREPGGVLFEVATDPPGFTVDEPAERLGTQLQLPPWLEPHRAQITAALPPIRPQGTAPGVRP